MTPKLTGKIDADFQCVEHPRFKNQGHPGFLVGSRRRRRV